MKECNLGKRMPNGKLTTEQNISRRETRKPRQEKDGKMDDEGPIRERGQAYTRSAKQAIEETGRHLSPEAFGLALFKDAEAKVEALRAKWLGDRLPWRYRRDIKDRQNHLPKRSV
jgi:hypothetical protein